LIVRAVEALDKKQASGTRNDLASRDARSGKSAKVTAGKVGTSQATVERARMA
jgi:hypothetical protein